MVASSNDTSYQSAPFTQDVRQRVPIKDEPAAPNKFVRFARHIYHPVGFKKGYNFVLFFIFGGAMLGFVLAHLSYLDITGPGPRSFINSTLPGEWYWYHAGRYRIGITLHLATCLPGSFFMLWQFIPIIRYKALILHRINGYFVITLLTLSNVGGLMIADKAFGGTIATRTLVGVVVIMTTVSMSLAIYNIKKLQIEQHRKWMLRCMVYMGFIITLRLIMIISANIIGSQGDTYETITCEELLYSLEFTSASPEVAMIRYNQTYPMCVTDVPNMTADRHVAIKAGFGNGAEGVSAAFKYTFGSAGWLALFLHAIGVEIYLALTPRESERLRRVSYERQLERGMKNPGSAGLTADRVGDGEWNPPRKEEQY